MKGLTFHGFKPGWDIVPAPLCMPCSYCHVSHRVMVNGEREALLKKGKWGDDDMGRDGFGVVDDDRAVEDNHATRSHLIRRGLCQEGGGVKAGSDEAGGKGSETKRSDDLGRMWGEMGHDRAYSPLDV